MKKTLVKSLALAFVGSLLVAGSAMAIPYSPTINDMLTWTYDATKSVGAVSSSSVDPQTIGLPPVTVGVDFNALFGRTANASAFATFGTGVDLDLSTFDTYAINLSNDNEASWDFTLYLEDTDGSSYTSTVLSLVNQTAGLLSMDLAAAEVGGIDLDDVTFIGLQVGFGIPRVRLDGTNDWQAEFSAKPVPEPATMLLLGTGLAGLAGARRRKASKKA